MDAIRSRWPDLQSAATSEPIFILSAGWRSGSTFLQRLVMSGDAFIWGEPYRHAALVDSMASQVKAFTDVWPIDKYFVDVHKKDTAFDREWVANMYPALADFLGAHVAFFERLFAKLGPVSQRSRWGLKEIGLTVDHACYLRWLFPKGRFIFLYRNPYDAYRSYRQWRGWYRAWPDKPVFTADSYGMFWSELAGDFIANHHKVDGLLVPYEELRSVETRKKIETYLQMPLADPASLPRLDGVREDERRSERRKVPGI